MLRDFMVGTVLVAGAMVSVCVAGAEQLALEVETFSRSNNIDTAEENVRLFQTSANDTVSLNGATTNSPAAAAIATLSSDGKTISEQAHLQTQSRAHQGNRVGVNRPVEKLVLEQKRTPASGRFWPLRFAPRTSSDNQDRAASSPVIRRALSMKVDSDLAESEPPSERVAHFLCSPSSVLGGSRGLNGNSQFGRVLMGCGNSIFIHARGLRLNVRSDSIGGIHTTEASWVGGESAPWKRAIADSSASTFRTVVPREIYTKPSIQKQVRHEMLRLEAFAQSGIAQTCLSRAGHSDRQVFQGEIII